MTVHWTQLNYRAMPETDGHGTTCGIDAMLSYLAIAKGMPLTIAQVDRMYDELHAMGLIDTPGSAGMSMNAMRTAFHHYGVQEVKFAPYSETLNFDYFRNDIITALGNRQCIVFETANAQALTGNQVGVRYHFVSLWGIDSTLGYYCANSDLARYFNPWTTNPQTPVWYGIGVIQNSHPVGYFILPAVEEKPDMIILEKDAKGYTTGAHNAAPPTYHIGSGFAQAVDTANLLQSTITLGETYIPIEPQFSNDGEISVAAIGTQWVLTWSKLTGKIALVNFAEAAILFEQLTKNALKPDNDAEVNAALTVVVQDVADTATSFAELQKDLAALQAAQSKDT